MTGQIFLVFGLRSSRRKERDQREEQPKNGPQETGFDSIVHNGYRYIGVEARDESADEAAQQVAQGWCVWK